MITLLLVILGVVVIGGALIQWLGSVAPPESVQLVRTIAVVILVIILVLLLIRLLSVAGVALP